MTEEKEKKLTEAQKVFIDEYLSCFNATEAYSMAYPNVNGRKSAQAASSRLLSNVIESEYYKAKLAEIHMSDNEALKMQADIARSGLGQFFKVSDEWTFYPLSTSEILDHKEVVDDSDPNNPKTRISYRERRIILDMDKVMDPKYSRLIKKFSDNKNGLSIELYPADVAQERILKVAGKFVNKVDLTSNGETIKPDESQYQRSISTLADAVGEILSRKSGEKTSEVDTPK